MMKADSFYFYDLETFGTHPQIDRIAQFAGIRTNSDLEIIDQPLVQYCKLSADYLPEPEACFVHGITPQEAQKLGLIEYDFIKNILKEFSVQKTCVIGYNSIRFDDEFIRAALYRNFFDPYEREYKNNNSRWDILDLARACHDLRPEGINWPVSEEGRPVFKLESLTKANNISHIGAHDALSDVKATIGLAKLIKLKQPKLFNYFFELRNKKKVLQIIEPGKNKMFVHTSRMFTSEKGCSTLMKSLIVHPKKMNYILGFDLRYDPSPLIDLSIKELKKEIFIVKGEEGFEQRIRIKGIYINKCPAVAPMEVLKNSESLGIDIELCKKNAEILENNWQEIIQKISKIYEDEPVIYEFLDDPDMQIYSVGFFPEADRRKFRMFHDLEPKEKFKEDLEFMDARVKEMMFRFFGRNYPELLSSDKLLKWNNFCADRINQGFFSKKTIFDFLEWVEEYSPKNEREKHILSEYSKFIKEKV